jgi:hypothetical protein
MRFVILQTTTCAQVRTNGWPNGEYLLSGESGVGLSYCIGGVKASYPFDILGSPMAFYRFEEFVSL